MFMSPPYEFPALVATILAQICCHKNSLPQGAPTSPIISNMICSKMDGELQKLARKSKSTYTRYADDITFSTNLQFIPKELGQQKENEFKVSQELTGVIESNGFTINHKKVRLQPRHLRQEVTGLIVNEFVNVKREYIYDIRSILHKWEKNGLSATSDEYFNKYCPISKKGYTKDFKKIIRGKIEFVRMIRFTDKRDKQKKRSKIFFKFLEKFHNNNLRDFQTTVIRTEGKTDCMHFQRAYTSLRKELPKFKNLNISFYQTKHSHGASSLLSFCEKAKKGHFKKFKNKIICVFDSDLPDINKIHRNNKFNLWAENIYSLVLPTENNSTAEICVELLYDEAIIKTEVDGLRLYLSNEFEKESGKHKTNPQLRYNGNLSYLNGSLKIIDSEVIDQKSRKNVALSKSKFAHSLYKSRPGFENINFKKFEGLFDRIAQIENGQ